METTKSVVEGLTAEHEEAMDFSLALCEDEIARDLRCPSYNSRKQIKAFH